MELPLIYRGVGKRERMELSDKALEKVGKHIHQRRLPGPGMPDDRYKFLLIDRQAHVVQCYAVEGNYSPINGIRAN
mgnify:CR=1 FL=1